MHWSPTWNQLVNQFMFFINYDIYGCKQMFRSLRIHSNASVGTYSTSQFSWKKGRDNDNVMSTSYQ